MKKQILIASVLVAACSLLLYAQTRQGGNVVAGVMADNRTVRALLVDNEGNAQVEIPGSSLTGLATSALQTTGNSSLSAIATALAPFLVSNAGGYVRQDSTATMAKETGGNLATAASGIGATNVAYNCATDTTNVSLVQAQKCTNYLLQNPVCPSSQIYDTNTNGKTELVALTSNQTIYVCGVSIVQSTTSAVTASLGSGTGTNCGSSYAAKTPAWVFPANTQAAMQGQVLPISSTPWFNATVSEALCLSTNAGVSMQVIVRYGKF